MAVTRRTLRLVRVALGGVVVAVGVSVAWSFRPHPAPSPSPTTAPPPASSPAVGTRMGELVYRQFKAGQENFLLRARSMAGQEQEELHLQGVDVTLSYTMKGTPGTARIVSDECVYTPTLQKAVFQGHVKLTTEDGFELLTQQLIYRGDKRLARSERPVRFARKDLSGTSTGAAYQAEEGKLELTEDVSLRIADVGHVPTDIRADHAVGKRDEGVMRFEGSVEVRQGADVLKAGRLVVNFGGEDQAVYRAQAGEGVDLQTSGGALPGTSGQPGGSGPRHLVARKLDVWFRPDRTLQEATAGPDAELTVLTGAGEPPEKRRIQSRFLAFRFDEAGRLQEVRTQKDTSVRVDPLPPGKGAPRTLTCQSLIARLDATTGLIQEVEFNKDVEFVEGPRRARARTALYEGPTAKLTLKEEPVVIDEEQGSRLTAQTIDVGTRSGDIAARQSVRHVLRLKRKGESAGLLVGRDEPSLLTCRLFKYDADTRTARYREDALLRSGKDEIRAAEIRLLEAKDATRRLEADGGVASLLNPQPGKDGKPAAPVSVQAAAMTYDEKAREVVYTGDVQLRQGDIGTRSPQATLVLSADGGAIETLKVGEPVEVRQGERTATGTRGTYTPSEQVMVLVGDMAVLHDPKQQVQGRSLTFHVGDDRILVDGEQEGRTQTIFKREAPKPRPKEPPRP